MVHNSKLLLKALNAHLLEVLDAAQFEVSDVKWDATVFVKTRSTDTSSALESADRLEFDLSQCGLGFIRVDDNRLRVPVEQFARFLSKPV